MRDDPERDSIFVEMDGVQSTITKRTIIAKYPVPHLLLRKSWWCISNS